MVEMRDIDVFLSRESLVTRKVTKGGRTMNKHDREQPMTTRSDTGPFAILPEWVLAAPISDRAVRLYAWLSRYADNGTGECWPSRKRLADQLGCSLSSLDRAKDELVEVGALSVQIRHDAAGQLSNLYTVIRSRPTGGGVTGEGTPLVTVDDPPLVTGAALTIPIQELDLNTRRRQPRRADLLFDAIIEVCGIDGSSLTVSSRGAVNKARQELAAVGADPGSIRSAAAQYRRSWPNVSLTPSSLAKHYPTFKVAAKPAVPAVVLGRPVDAPPVWELGDDGVARPVRAAVGGLEAVDSPGVVSGTG